MWIAVIGSACTDEVRSVGDDDDSAGMPAATSTGGSSTGSGGADDTSTGGDDQHGVKLDVGPGAAVCGGGGGNEGGPANCDEQSPELPDSFTPKMQWSWMSDAASGENEVVATPVVGSLTDDDGDGAITPCDVPDVVIVAYRIPDNPHGDHATAQALYGALVGAEEYPYNPGGHIYVLDGATGQLHRRFDRFVSLVTTPALADLDGDRVVEIITATREDDNRDAGQFNCHLVAFHHDGSILWEQPAGGTQNCDDSVSVADLDADGRPELLGSNAVFAADGTRRFGLRSPAVAAFDLDGDGLLEVLTTYEAYRSDGAPYFDVGPLHDGYVPAATGVYSGTGIQAVADLDGDDDPEILSADFGKFMVLDHAGNLIQTVSEGLDPIYFEWTLGVFDIAGDARREIIVAGDAVLEIFDSDLELLLALDVDDPTGVAQPTAFDFLGDGTAEILFSDQTAVRIWDSDGQELLTVPRTSWTAFEFPVVVDVDADGAAEIITVSNFGLGTQQQSPAVQVFGDVADKWVPARRIWNQLEYTVTNVADDGTIPRLPQRHWQSFNTYRAQAQYEFEGGGLCIPPVG